MAETCWCVKDKGELKLRTLFPHRRGAIVNFLMVHRNVMIYERHTDKDIEALWEQHKRMATVVKVSIEEVQDAH